MDWTFPSVTNLDTCTFCKTAVLVNFAITSTDWVVYICAPAVDWTFPSVTNPDTLAFGKAIVGISLSIIATDGFIDIGALAIFINFTLTTLGIDRYIETGSIAGVDICITVSSTDWVNFKSTGALLDWLLADALMLYFHLFALGLTFVVICDVIITTNRLKLG